MSETTRVSEPLGPIARRLVGIYRLADPKIILASLVPFAAGAAIAHREGVRLSPLLALVALGAVFGVEVCSGRARPRGRVRPVAKLGRVALPERPDEPVSLCRGELEETGKLVLGQERLSDVQPVFVFRLQAEDALRISSAESLRRGSGVSVGVGVVGVVTAAAPAERPSTWIFFAPGSEDVAHRFLLALVGRLEVQEGLLLLVQDDRRDKLREPLCR